MLTVEKKTGKQFLHVLFWPALIAVVLLGIAFMLQWFLALELDEGFWELLSYRWLAAAIGTQAMVVLVFVLAWRKNLQLHGVSISMRQAVAMIGINSMGKYSPGKVLGILARGAAMYKMHADSRVAVQTTLVEQIAMLHSGGAVMLLGWLLDSGRLFAAILALVAVAISVLVASRSGETLVKLVARLSRKHALDQGSGQGFTSSYTVVFIAMLLIWGLSALALHYCILAFDYDHMLRFWWLLWILALAYLGGFAAFLLPAGLGAREGVLLAFLASQLDTSVAAYVVVLHRLITLLLDLMLGTSALLSGKSLDSSTMIDGYSRE